MPPHSGLPLPSCRVGSGLHSFSGWFKVGMGQLVIAYYRHCTHMGWEGGGGKGRFQPLFSHNQGGYSTKHKRGGYPGCKLTCLQGNWRCPFSQHYYLGFDVVWVQYPTVLCWFQAMKVRSSSYARLSYTWPMNMFKEASGFDFEYSLKL